MKTFVIGDIHGQHAALKECLQVSGFDNGSDRLIALGDVCDRGPATRGCIDELLQVRRLVYLLGNHDAWTLEWAISGEAPLGWLEQGGEETVASYGEAGLPPEHVAFLKDASLYLEEGGRFFVHGGFDPDLGVRRTSPDVFYWDRELLEAAARLQRTDPGQKFGGYEEIFLSHTPTLFYGSNVPMKFCNVWALDTGAGYGRMLTIMDVETHQYWQAKC